MSEDYAAAAKVPDSVVGAQANPVGDRAVLLHLFAQNALGLE